MKIVMKTVYSLALVLLVGCTSEQPAKVQHSGVGYVRSVNSIKWGLDVVFEAGDGRIKGYRFCEDDAPLWKGEHLTFDFTWDYLGECYHFVSGVHLPPDVKP